MPGVHSRVYATRLPCRPDGICEAQPVSPEPMPLRKSSRRYLSPSAGKLMPFQVSSSFCLPWFLGLHHHFDRSSSKRQLALPYRSVPCMARRPPSLFELQTEVFGN